MFDQHCCLLTNTTLVLLASSQAASSKPSPPQVLGRKDLPAGSSSNSSTKAAAALLGVLELGGGSLQVTFVPQSAPPLAEAAALALPSLGAGRLYSRSFDGVGLQVCDMRHCQLARCVTASCPYRPRESSCCIRLGSRTSLLILRRTTCSSSKFASCFLLYTSGFVLYNDRFGYGLLPRKAYRGLPKVAKLPTQPTE